MLKREEILGKTELRKEKINIPEWGGEVYVSEMSGSARDAWESAIKEKDETGKITAPRAKLVAYVVVDEKGNRIFQDEDIEAIGKLSSEALEKVCLLAMRLNGLGADEIEKAKKN